MIAPLPVVHPVLSFARAASALLLLAACPWAQSDEAAPAPNAAPAAPLAPVATLPAGEYDGLLLVDVRVGEHEPLACILDTGMPEGLFVFDPALGRALGLEYAATVPVNGTGPDARTAGVALGLTLRLGELALANERAIVLTERSELADLGVQGVIGASVFQRWVAELDLHAGELRLFDPAAHAAAPLPTGTTAVPFELAGTRPYVPARVALDDGAPHDVRLFLDTGANGELFLDPAQIEGLGLPEQTLGAGAIEGVGGRVESRIGRVSTLALGGLELRELLARFPSSRIAEEQGTLGMPALRGFVVGIDYPGARLLLRPSGAERAPSEYNMAGLGMRVLAGGVFRVDAVVPGAPGDRAGLREGDLLTHVDGRPVAELGAREVRRLLTQPGAVLRLRFERDGEVLEHELTLRRLI